MWVGGKQATGFNIAALFVVQCRKLYGVKEFKSGWVLPQAAIKGGNWENYVNLEWSEKRETSEKIEDIANIYDLGDLAFPKHSKSCVQIFNVKKEEPKRLVLNKNEKRPAEKEIWNSVQNKTSFLPIKIFPTNKSEWLVKEKKPIARNGATIFPHCLVVLKNCHEKGSYIVGETISSKHNPWKKLGSFKVNIPKNWVKKVLFNKGGLFPYRIGEPRKVMLPINEKGEFLSEIEKEKCWRDACDNYSKYKGKGKATPKTLETRLNHQNQLQTQFPFKKNTVVYNTSGSNLYAARLISSMIIDSALYRVQTKSEKEALFLIGILNAECLNERFRFTRKSDRHFTTYFWKDVPIPRFKQTNKDHVLLSNLAREAEKIAKETEPLTYQNIKNKLREQGISSKIGKVVTRIIDAGDDRADSKFNT